MVRFKDLLIAGGILGLVWLAGCAPSGIRQPEAAPTAAPAVAAVAEIPASTLKPLIPTLTPTLLDTPTPQPSPTETAVPNTPTISPTPTETPTATPDTRLKPDQWRAWPIVPTLSARALEIYRIGQQAGNNPHVFSRIGDCQSESAIFMGIYDDPNQYVLNKDYQYMQATIDQFAGSFKRVNITVKRGFGIASVFNPLLADREQCNSDETPLACEYRLNKPIIAFISMGTNWCAGCTNKFEEYLRKIVDYSIQQGVIPVLSTKADNIEKDWSLDEVMAKVAYEYDIPLWNFWKAVQYLPNHGLMGDNVYLTVPGWNERSFTGLQTLDALWLAIQKEESSN